MSASPQRPSKTPLVTPINLALSADRGRDEPSIELFPYRVGACALRRGRRFSSLATPRFGRDPLPNTSCQTTQEAFAGGTPSTQPLLESPWLSLLPECSSRLFPALPRHEQASNVSRLFRCTRLTKCAESHFEFDRLLGRIACTA